jgi:hypothetical protein
MTSIGTDFETHAIWQGYIEDPTAKYFVVRKARTIALSKVQGSCHKTSDNQPYLRVWKSLRDSYPSCTAQLSGAYVMQESVSSRIFVSKKGMICVRPMDVCTRNLWQKVERGKKTGSEATTRFPQASCFEKPMRSVPEI